MTKYYISSDFVSAHLSGYVEAKSKKEAKEKWFNGDTIGEIEEEPTREETNLNIEEE